MISPLFKEVIKDWMVTLGFVIIWIVLIILVFVIAYALIKMREERSTKKK